MLAVQFVAVPPPVPVILPDTRRSTRTLAFDVAIRREGLLLWQGQLTMASGSPASFSQRLESTRACPPIDGRNMAARLSTGLQLSIGPSFDIRADNAVRVIARFDRPSEGASSCEQASTRSVDLQTVIMPVPNKAVLLTADAGYSITLVLHPDI